MKRNTWMLVAGIAGAIVLGIAVVLVLDPSPLAEPEVTPRDVVLHPELYEGREVTVSERVSAVLAPGLFVLRAEIPAGALLVAAPEDAAAGVTDISSGTPVRVRGEVTPFSVEAIGEASGVDPDELSERLASDVFIAAEAVDVIGADDDGAAEELTAAEVLAEPGRYLGRLVAVDGLVVELISESAVLLRPVEASPGAEVEELLVVGRDVQDRLGELSLPTPAEFIGRIYRFDVSAFERALWIDLEDDLLDERSGEFALLLDETIE